MASKNTPAVAPQLSADQIQAAMIEYGLIQPGSGGAEITRIKMTGNNFSVGDDLFASYNPVTKEAAFRVQIVDKPAVHQKLWFTVELARLTGHDELLSKMGDNGTFCKSHEDNPNEQMKISENGYECRACPVNGFIKNDDLPTLADGTRAKRCSIAADLDVRIIEEDGTLRDETVYTMNLSSTALVEFRGGTGKKAEPENGYLGINPKARPDKDQRNFIHKLIEFGMSQKGLTVPQILTAIRMGLVLAEVRSLPATNEAGSMNWNVLNFTPLDILDAEATGAIESAEQPADTDTDADPDAVPF